MATGTVAGAIVTHNRRDLLRESVRALLDQTVPVREAIVVDNVSTDGTREMLAEEFPEVTVVALQENLATGSFSEAIAAGLHTGADWIWLYDDDCVPRPDALEQLLAAAGELTAPDPPALLCSRVEWTDGSLHGMNLPIMPRQRDRELVHQVRDRPLPVRAATYVSILFRREAVEAAGAPRRDFFYQTDDIEYTARMLRDARGYYVPQSVVEHRTPGQHTAVNDDNRMWYHLRNTVLMMRTRSWRLREKPRLAWWIVQTTLVYLRINRLSPRAVRNVLAALFTGARGKTGPRD